MHKSTVGILVTAIAVILFVTEIIPLAVTAMAAALAMGVTGCITLNDAISGFGGSTVHMVAGMMVIGDAVFETGLAERLGNWIKSSSFAKTERSFAIVVVTAATLLSAFFSNSATIAMFIPLVAVAAATSGGKIHAKNITLAAGMGAAVGGGSTLVGSTAQLVGQGIMINMGVEPMGVFTLTKVMGPLTLLFLLWYSLIGYKVQKRVVADMIEEIPPSQQLDSNTVKTYQPWKQWMVIAVTIFCIAGFVMGFLNVGIIALIGATILIASGCMELKKTLRNLDWNTLILIGAAQGFALGLAKSGGGKVLSDAAIQMCGGPSASPVVLLSVVVVLSAVLTNFMSNTAVAAMLVPIIIPMARDIGANPQTFSMGIVMAANIALATPIGTAAVTQTMVCGYRYMDCVKIGLPINIILIIGLIIGLPMAYGI